MSRLLTLAMRALASLMAFMAASGHADAQRAYTHSLELDASPGLTLHTSPTFPAPIRSTITSDL